MMNRHSNGTAAADDSPVVRVHRVYRDPECTESPEKKASARSMHSAHSDNRRAEGICARALPDMLDVTEEELQRLALAFRRSAEDGAHAATWRAIWPLARAVRGLDGVKQMKPDPNAFKRLLAAWYNEIAANMPESLPTQDDIRGAWLAAWERVAVPDDGRQLEHVLAEAGRVQVPAWAEEHYDDEATHRLIAACEALQRMTGADPFFLSCRVAGDHLSESREKARRRLGLLVADGVLEVVEPPTAKRATRYRYMGEPERDDEDDGDIPF